MDEHASSPARMLQLDQAFDDFTICKEAEMPRIESSSLLHVFGVDDDCTEWRIHTCLFMWIGR
ncbi:hypothetical protein D9M68_866910 [compost metagenome]